MAIPFEGRSGDGVDVACAVCTPSISYRRFLCSVGSVHHDFVSIHEKCSECASASEHVLNALRRQSAISRRCLFHFLLSNLTRRSFVSHLVCFDGLWAALVHLWLPVVNWPVGDDLEEDRMRAAPATGLSKYDNQPFQNQWLLVPNNPRFRSHNWLGIVSLLRGVFSRPNRGT